MNELKLHFSVPFIIFLTIMGLFSFGISALILLLATRSWPRVLDQEGMTLRNGKRLLWKDATEFRRVNLNLYGVAAGGRLEVFFGRKKIRISLNSFRENRQIMPFLSRRFGWKH